MLLLAQSASGDAIFWTVVLLVIVIIASAGVMFLRKKLSPNEDFRSEGFTLADLRRLHKEGKLSDQEFEVAKHQLVRAMKKAAEKKDQAKTGGFPVVENKVPPSSGQS